MGSANLIFRVNDILQHFKIHKSFRSWDPRSGAGKPQHAWQQLYTILLYRACPLPCTTEMSPGVQAVLVKLAAWNKVIGGLPSPSGSMRLPAKSQVSLWNTPSISSLHQQLSTFTGRHCFFSPNTHTKKVAYPTADRFTVSPPTHTPKRLLIPL